MLTEDYYVANKLMKGFIGSANIDTNSRLCMASSVAGHKRAFGSDTVPGCYEDLELADLVVLTGSNTAWCHPVLYQRLVAAKAARPAMKIVVIDPRRTATCDIADLHLSVRADGDVALFNGLFHHLVDNGHVDEAFIGEHTSGFSEALMAATRLSMAQLSEATGVSGMLLRQFFKLFAETEKTVTCYSQGVNQSALGTDKVNAIINCHLATGRIGRPGMGPFSLTGQPNAMGGREVGGLANMLAAHMEIGSAAHRDTVQRFWNAPVIADKPGLKAVDMFEAVADGRIKAIWIMSTNPVVSMPDADAVRDALQGLPLCRRLRHSGQHGHRPPCPCPAARHRLGREVGHGHQFRTPHLPPAAVPARPRRGAARLVANGRSRQAHGLCEGFDFTSPAEIFAEHAALSAYENDGIRDFDIGAYAEIDTAGYDALIPFQWPQPAAPSRKRFFADGRFYHRTARRVSCLSPRRLPWHETKPSPSRSTPAASAIIGTR